MAEKNTGSQLLYSFEQRWFGEIRRVLDASGKVLAVFQGHHHPGGYSHIAGIHYYTLKATVEGAGPENNSYAIAEVDSYGNVTVAGYRKAESRRLTPSPAHAL